MYYINIDIQFFNVYVYESKNAQILLFINKCFTKCTNLPILMFAHEHSLVSVPYLHLFFKYAVLDI